MSSLSVQSTYPIFTETDGQPLENGYIWIGTANLDPQTNPIAVYWDAALTIPAAQPIRTLGGYLSRNGSPANIYVAQEYSIRVMNKNGSTIYSAPNGSTDRLSSSQISYLPAGTGAVSTTVQAKLLEIVSLADFNETAYHVVRVPSEYPTLQAAFDALAPGVFKSGQYIEVLIENAHALTHGLDLSYGDYSHFRISSEQATVTLAPSFAYVDSTYRAVMRVTYAKAPQWNILVDCGGQIGRALMYLNGSTGYVYPNKGATNAIYFGALDDGAGIYANSGSSISAASSNFSNCTRGAWITRGSLANLESANLSYATFIGLYASRGCGVGAEYVNVSYCGTYGVDSNRSIVMAANANGNNCTIGGFLAENAGTLDCTSSTATTCGSFGVSSENSSTIHARNVNASGAGSFGFRVTIGSRLDKTGATGTAATLENIQTSAGIITDNGLTTPISYSSGSLISQYRTKTGTSKEIPVNTVFSIDLIVPSGSAQGAVTVISSGVGNGFPNGLFRYRVGSSPSTNNISFITTTNIVFTTGVLTGTTGAVGDFTISAATDGKLYFENRTASSKNIVVSVIG